MDAPQALVETVGSSAPPASTDATTEEDRTVTMLEPPRGAVSLESVLKYAVAAGAGTNQVRVLQCVRTLCGVVGCHAWHSTTPLPRHAVSEATLCGMAGSCARRVSA